MVEDHDTVWLDSTQNVVVSAPGQISDRLLGSLDGRESLPALVIGRGLGTHHLALPHDDETVLCATTQNAFFLIERNRVDFVVEKLSLEGGFIH